MTAQKRMIATAGMVGAIALLAAGCGGSSSGSGTSASSGPKVVKVALITKFPVAFYTAMDDAAKAYDAKTPGVEVSYFSCKTPSDTACQIAQIEDAVTKKFQAIVITPMGPEVEPAMKTAATQGVKIVLADNDLADFTDKVAVVATDNVKGGLAAGAYLKTQLKSGDTIGLMEGVRGVPALDARIAGVKSSLAGTGVNIIIGGAETKCDAATGATVAEDLLTKNPNLTAIYSACDDPAISAAKVAKAKGKHILIMGYDGLPDTAKGIQAGDITATIAQYPGKMGALGVEAAMNAVNGQPVDAKIDTGTTLVTKDNAAQFVNFQ